MKKGSTGRCSRDFTLLTKTDRKGHYCPGGFQKFYVIFSYVPVLLAELLTTCLPRTSAQNDKVFREIVKDPPFQPKKSFGQGQVLAGQILAAKLPNSDLNFAVDFWLEFYSLSSFQEKSRPQKSI